MQNKLNSNELNIKEFEAKSSSLISTLKQEN